MRAAVCAVAAGVALTCAAPAHATWPGANGRLAWFAGRGDGTYVLRSGTLDGRRVRRIALFPRIPLGLQDQSGLALWSPSGRRIAYVRYGTGVETASASGRRLTRARGIVNFPSWSPSGRELLVVGGTDFLLRMRPGGGAARRIAVPLPGPAFPIWAPDGRWIVWEADHSLWRMRPDGSGARRLVDGRRAVWSPDGREIAFAVGPDVVAIRPDGSGRRYIVRARNRDSGIAGLTWSPDGRRVAFIRQVPADGHDSSTVYSAPARGGRARLEWRAEEWIRDLDWQPVPR